MATTQTEFFLTLAAPLDLHGSATPADVVTRIRADIKAATKAGLIPAHAKFSITRRDYKSIHVDVMAWNGAALSPSYELYIRDCIAARMRNAKGPEWTEGGFGRRSFTHNPRLSDDLQRVITLAYHLASMHNYDRSDIQTDYFDVGYHLDVTANYVLSMVERGIRAEMDPQYQNLILRAVHAASTLPENVRKAECGKLAPEHCGDWTLTRLLDLAAKFGGKGPVIFNKSARRWELAA